MVAGQLLVRDVERLAALVEPKSVAVLEQPLLHR